MDELFARFQEQERDDMGELLAGFQEKERVDIWVNCWQGFKSRIERING